MINDKWGNKDPAVGGTVRRRFEWPASSPARLGPSAI